MTTKIHLRIGKQGVTESFIQELKLQLEQSRTVHIKLLQSAREQSDRKELAQQLAEKQMRALTNLLAGYSR